MSGRVRGRRSFTEGDNESDGMNPLLNTMAQLLEHLVDPNTNGNGQTSGRIVTELERPRCAIYMLRGDAMIWNEEDDQQQLYLSSRWFAIYKDSAVDLMFMESAAGLEMETSKVESAVPGSYSDQQMKRYQQLRRCVRYRISCDDFSLDVITISSWLSADGLALMTSLVTSSYSADGLRKQSQESAGSLFIQTQVRSDVVKEAIQSQATVHQQISQAEASRRKIPVAVFEASAVAQSIQVQRIVEIASAYLRTADSTLDVSIANPAADSMNIKSTAESLYIANHRLDKYSCC
ncbi:hypothetical protein F511_09067 [Dorcoceras hygrometricum]|uniref:Uncharacterized protein n=1 Tax=Dorcoceras hygrometricum TaxID=472368 RepID=A0A2Z7AAV3_9LAMI|nr:hypothetical protein F511_09067 [Dorcoceras hygrometricum]